MAESTPASGSALLPSDLEVGGDVELSNVGAAASSGAEEEPLSSRQEQGADDEQNREMNTQNAEHQPSSNEANGEQQSGENEKAEVQRKKPPLVVDPAKLLEPIRTDPIKALEARKRRLERQVEPSIPEVHYVGQFLSISKVINDAFEGCFVRWKIDTGTVWEHLDGEILGQTHIAYCEVSEKERLPLNHPIDVHFAAAGLQGWNAPRMTVQCYRLDLYGRKIMAGYGFVHLPLAVGAHRLDIDLWRPVGTPDQELRGFLLGETQALIDHEPVYEAAWKDRCRLLTVAAGKVTFELFVLTRNMNRQGIDDHLVK